MSFSVIKIIGLERICIQSWDGFLAGPMSGKSVSCNFTLYNLIQFFANRVYHRTKSVSARKTRP